MAENKEIKQETLPDALGLSDEWVEETFDLIGEAFSNSKTVSEALEKVMKQRKDEEFGGDYELSDYERKIAYVGFEFAKKLSEIKSHDQLFQTLTSALLGAAKINIKKKDKDTEQD